MGFVPTGSRRKVSCHVISILLARASWRTQKSVKAQKKREKKRQRRKEQREAALEQPREREEPDLPATIVRVTDRGGALGDPLDLDDFEDGSAEPGWISPPGEPFIDPIDWKRATTDVPTYDPLDGGDLEDPGFAALCAHRLTRLLQAGYYLQWDGDIREEQGIATEPFHENAIAEMDDVPDDDDWDDAGIPDPDELARPCEPWYETLRRLAPHLLVVPLDTTDATGIAPILEWPTLMGTIEGLSDMLAIPTLLPDHLHVLDDELLQGLVIQGGMADLEGVGHTEHGDTITLKDPENAVRVEMFIETLDEHFDSAAQLGLTMESLRERLVIAPAEREIFEQMVRRTLGLRSDTQPLATRLPLLPDELRFPDEELTSLTDEELIDALLHAGLDVPDGLPMAIVEHGEAMVEPLLGLLRDESLADLPEDDPRGWAPIHALHLAAAVASEAFLPVLVERIRQGQDNDFFDEVAPVILGRIGPAAIEPMERIVREPGDDPLYTVPVAASALVCIGYLYPAHRPAIAQFLATVLAQDEDEEVVTWVALSARYVDDPLVRAGLDAALASGVVDEFVLDVDTLARYRAQRPPWTSTLEMQPLEYFTEESLERLRRINE